MGHDEKEGLLENEERWMKMFVKGRVVSLRVC